MKNLMKALSDFLAWLVEPCDSEGNPIVALVPVDDDEPLFLVDFGMTRPEPRLNATVFDWQAEGLFQ